MKRVLLVLTAFALTGAGTGLAIAGSCGSSKAQAASADQHHMTQAGYTEERTDIVDLAVSAGSFQTLTAALTATGLVEVLRGEGPFTVFAPTDEAFAKLPEGTVESLLRPENKEKLVAILTYHVAPGSLGSEEVASRRNIETVNGERIQINETKEGLRLGDSKILQADLLASNGVVHVIDSVLLPN